MQWIRLHLPGGAHVDRVMHRPHIGEQLFLKLDPRRGGQRFKVVDVCHDPDGWLKLKEDANLPDDRRHGILVHAYLSEITN